jgi:hypothetical protein
MAPKKGQRLGGVYELEDLRLRSRIEPECGCWRWGLRKNPAGAASVTMVLDGKKRDMNGRRAALILAGFKPKPGQDAIPLAICPHVDCVNFEHSRFGSRKERNQALAARGVWGDPSNYAALVAHARSIRKLDDNKRLEVACSPETGKAWAERLGVSESLISAIRRGERRSPVASVFEWRGAAAMGAQRP